KSALLVCPQAQPNLRLPASTRSLKLLLFVSPSSLLLPKGVPALVAGASETPAFLRVCRSSTCSFADCSHALQSSWTTTLPFPQAPVCFCSLTPTSPVTTM